MNTELKYIVVLTSLQLVQISLPCSSRRFMALNTTIKYTRLRIRESSPEKKPILLQLFNHLKSKSVFKSEILKSSCLHVIARQVMSKRKFVQTLEKAIPIAPRLSPDSKIIRIVSN